jgi:hypothetical protein
MIKELLATIKMPESVDRIEEYFLFSLTFN